MQVAVIDESASTIGIADSELYLQGTLEQINQRLDLMQSLGVTNVRILVPWAGVQPLHPDTPFGLGAPRWDQLDMVVNAAAERGMGILGVLNSTPVWATNRTPINGQPTDVTRFADFARSVALRYGDKISAYEVWNEPNSAQFWNPLDPVAYTEMLKVTYTALKDASAQIGSEITVVGGVVGAGLTWGNATMNPIDFVQRMYDAGADGYFDALSFHPYNYDSKFSVGESLPWREGMPLYQVNRIRELMDSYQDVGEEQVKIWITEYGVPTNRVSEATQAAFIRDLIEFWQTAEGAGPIFVYTIQDRLNPAGNDDEAHLGIFRPDGTMKPAAEVIRELIEELANPTEPGPDPDPGPGPVIPSNPVAALLQALQQAVSSVLNLVPNLLNAVGVAITNLISGIFGNAPRSATTRSVRSATSDGDAVTETAETDADDAADGAVDEAADGDATTAGLRREPRGAETVPTPVGGQREVLDDTGLAEEAESVEEPVETQPETTEATAEPEPTTDATTEPVADPDVPEPSGSETTETVGEGTVDDDVDVSDEAQDADDDTATDDAATDDAATDDAAADDAATDDAESDSGRSESRETDDVRRTETSDAETERETQTENGTAGSDRVPAGASAAGTG